MCFFISEKSGFNTGEDSILGGELEILDFIDSGLDGSGGLSFTVYAVGCWFSVYFDLCFEVFEAIGVTGLNSADGTDGIGGGSLPGCPDIVVADNAFKSVTATDFVVSSDRMHGACSCNLYSK